MITIWGLEKNFGGVRALRSVNLTIDRGAITAIVGPNGSGKSTLIKTILGLTKPDDGRLEIDGQFLNGQSEYRRMIGYMPQVGHFPENLRVGDVMKLVKKIRGQQEASDSDLAVRLGLDHEMDKRIKTLSGGTRQKLNAAVAFMFPSLLFILDEPTVGLDPVASGILKSEIFKRKEQGKTILLTSHIMSEVDELADNIVFLNEGLIIFAGAKSSLKSETGCPGLEEALAVLMKEGDRLCH